MVMPSVANAIDVVAGLVNQVMTGTVTGSGIDISGYDGTLLVHLAATAASTGDTLDLTVEESHDNSTFTAVPADALFNPATGAAATFAQVTDAATAAAKNQTLGLKKDRLKQYIRFVATLAGGSISMSASVTLIGPKKYA